MGWFGKKRKQEAKDPEGLPADVYKREYRRDDLRSVALDWLEFHKGFAGSKIEWKPYDLLGAHSSGNPAERSAEQLEPENSQTYKWTNFHKAINASFRLGRHLAYAISGGANGGDIEPEKARTQQQKRKFRDLLRADVREVYSMWRQRHQQSVQNQLTPLAQPESVAKEPQNLHDQTNRDPPRSSEELLSAAEEEYRLEHYDRSTEMLRGKMGLTDPEIDAMWEKWAAKRRNVTEPERIDKNPGPAERNHRDQEEVAYQMFLRGENFIGILEMEGYDQERKLKTHGMFLERVYKQAKDALSDGSESLARSILRHVHNPEYLNSLIDTWKSESAAHGREETKQRLMSLFDRWDAERADEQKPRQPYRGISIGINLLSPETVTRNARLVYVSGEIEESRRILKKTGHGLLKRRRLVLKWERELLAAERQAENLFYEDDVTGCKETLRRTGYKDNHVDAYVNYLQREKADVIAREEERLAEIKAKAERLESKRLRQAEKQERREQKKAERFERKEARQQAARRFRYVVPSLLIAGTVIASGSIGYQKYVIKPRLSGQYVQSSAEQAKSASAPRPVVVPAPVQQPATKPEQKTEEKPTFHGPIAPAPAAPSTTAPATISPTQPRTEPASPRVATPVPAPVQPAPQPVAPRKPEELPKIAYIGETGRKREVAIYEVPWLITKIREERRGEYSDIILEAFYDEDDSSYWNSYEPSVNARIRGYTPAEAKQIIDYVSRCLAEKKRPYIDFDTGQGYLNLSGNNFTDIVANKNGALLNTCK